MANNLFHRNMWPSSAKDVSKDNNTKGLTSAISVAHPKPEEIERTNELIETLVNYDVEETDEELNHRMEVLSRLNTLVKEWIVEMSVAKNMPVNAAEQVGGKIYTFGSYRLGVHQKGADIDALCIAPRHIDRQDYFTIFYEKLKKCVDVKELRTVEEAFVPVLKMNFDRIEIDLLFARLALKEIPDNMDLGDDQILKNLDPKCVRSLNGCRVTDEILRLVPNIETFKLALRAIKLWAKQHGIYSNVLGYLGGVSWAMLVARTCQLYPNAAAAVIVHKFFLVFSQWKWPNPVLLKAIANPTNLSFPVWDPKSNIADRAHLMPIITPAYPQQNSTFNVSHSTLTVMQHELKFGFQIVEDIIMGRSKWNLLFEKPNFFARYLHFIVLIAASNTPDEQLEWYGLVESKIRHLVTILEKNECIEAVHANPEAFKHKISTDKKPPHDEQESLEPDMFDIQNKPNTLWFVGLQFIKAEKLNINLTQEIQSFINAVLRHATSIKMYKESMTIEAKYVKKRELVRYIPKSIIKRDRSIVDIFAPLLAIGNENSATILLRRNSSEEAMASLLNKRKTTKRKSDQSGIVGNTDSAPGSATKPQIKLRRKSDINKSDANNGQLNGTGGKMNDSSSSENGNNGIDGDDTESCVSSCDTGSTVSTVSGGVNAGQNNDSTNNCNTNNSHNGEDVLELHDEKDNGDEDVSKESHSHRRSKHHRRHKEHKKHKHRKHHKSKRSSTETSVVKAEENAEPEDEPMNGCDGEEEGGLIDLQYGEDNNIILVLDDSADEEQSVQLKEEDSIDNNTDVSFIDLTDSEDSDVTFVSSTCPGPKVVQKVVTNFRYK